MPASAATRKLAIQVGYDASQVMQGVPPSKAAVASLGNELRGLKNSFADSGGDVRQYQQALQDVRLRALDLADGLDITSREYAQLTGVAAQATKEVQRSERQLDGVRGSAINAAGGVEILAGAFGSLVGIFGAQQIGQWIGDSSKLAEEAKKTSLALETLSGGQAAQSINTLTTALDGSVSKMEAAKIASALFATGVADSAKEAAHFAELAAALGSTVGTDVATSIEFLRLAIDNLSYDRLGELGLSADAVRTRVKELKEEGLSLGEAFKTATLEQAEARFRELSEAGVEVGTSTDRMTSKWTDFSVALGTMVEPSISGVKDALAELLGVAATSLEETNQRTVEVADAQSLLRDAMAETGVTLVELDSLQRTYNDNIMGTADMVAIATMAQAQAEAQTRLLAEAFLENADAQGVAQQAAAVLFDELSGLDIAQQLVADSAIDAKNGLIVAEGGMYAAGDAAVVNAQKVWALKDALDAVAASQAGLSNVYDTKSTLERKDELDAFNRRRQNPGIDPNEGTSAFAFDQQQRLLDRWEREAEAAADAVEKAQREANRAAARGASEAERAAKKSAAEQKRALQELEREAQRVYNNISGFVGQALTFNTSVGPDDALKDRFGLRNQNASDELVRQIQDVADRAAEGARSPWLAFFPELDAATTDEIRARALRLIDDLQAGLRTDLLDPEKVKQDVRELIQAQQEAAAFQARITNELIGEGIGQQDASAGVKALLGSAGGQNAATDTGADIGAALVDSLEAQVKADGARYVGIGELVGVGIRTGTLGALEGLGLEAVNQILDEVRGAIAA